MKKKILTYATILVIAILAMFVISTNVNAADVKNDLESEDTKTIVLDTDAEISQKVQVKGTKTLDLNGKKLTIKGVIANRLSVTDGATLIVTGNGTIKADENVRVLFDVEPGATLKLENGTYIANFDDHQGRAIQAMGEDSNASAVEIGENATINADRPIMIADNTRAKNIKIDVYGKVQAVSYALYVNGSIKNTTGNVPEINVYPGASVTSEKVSAVYAAGYAKWNISGGTFEGTEALSIKAGEFYITGGKFYANGEFNETPSANGNGIESTGSAISITNNDAYAGNIIVHISNAVVTSENGYAVFEKNTNSSNPTLDLEITEGTFKGKGKAVYSQNEKEFIKGGIFIGEFDNNYLSKTVNSEEENGEIYVGTRHNIVLEETENGKVVASKENAIKGQSVKLEVTPAEGYKLSSLKVYLKGSTEEVKVNDNTFTMPDSDVLVQARFEKVQQVTPDEPEKDDTPKMGAIDVALITSVVAIVSVAGIVAVKKYSK